MAYSSRNGAAHRAVALDLMLRTFMNSPDFQPYNPKMWDGIAKMIPGTSPQQVSHGVLGAVCPYLCGSFLFAVHSQMGRASFCEQQQQQQADHPRPLFTYC